MQRIRLRARLLECARLACIVILLLAQIGCSPSRCPRGTAVPANPRVEHTTLTGPMSLAVRYWTGREWGETAQEILARLSGPLTATAVDVVGDSGERLAVVQRAQINWADDLLTRRDAFLGVTLAAVESPSRVEVSYAVARFVNGEEKAVLGWEEVAAHVQRTVEVLSTRSGRPPRDVRVVFPNFRVAKGVPRSFWIAALRTLSSLDRLGVRVAEVEFWVNN